MMKSIDTEYLDIQRHIDGCAEYKCHICPYFEEGCRNALLKDTQKVLTKIYKLLRGE